MTTKGKVNVTGVPDPNLWHFPVEGSRGLLNQLYCQNIVATIRIVDLPDGATLDKDALRVIGAKCNLPLFHAIALRVQPGCTVLLFATGKVVISGGKSIQDMNCGSLTAVSILNNMLIGNFHVEKRVITNIVGTAYLPPGHTLDFDAIISVIPLQCMVAFLFAGMFVHMPAHHTNFILFRSGAIVVRSNCIDNMTKGILNLEEILLRCNAVRVAPGVTSVLSQALWQYNAAQAQAQAQAHSRARTSSLSAAL